ncbi:MAG: acyloxyacyl hydrolase [Candidatus Omnitrophica bacterium]|nr:acyloxyacyl hydrolase [Candidatus Omnitrophota bacterium]
MKSKFQWLIVLVYVVLAVENSLAEGKKLTSREWLIGYGYAKVAGPKDYIIYPVAIDFNFPLPFHRPESPWQLQLEPFLAYVSTPESNAEVGGSFFIKYRFLPGRFQPYLKAGSGIIFFTQNLQEQSISFNFASSLGLGLAFSLNEQRSLVAEARYRHVSNAGIKEPNSGIDSRLFFLGINWPL